MKLNDEGLLSHEDVSRALDRIKNYINKTPVLSSTQLNSYLGHNFYFKAECLQKTGAFKARGALNTLLWLKEKHLLPKSISAYSSGNHSQAVSWATTLLKIPTKIYMPSYVSNVKLQATRSYGAEVILCDSRQEAEDRAENDRKNGSFLLPPFDHNQVICGQGTASMEAFEQLEGAIDAVFTPCGGGGLLSGTLIATRGYSEKTLVIGAEPLQANDAFRSLKEGNIFRWKTAPETLADGAKTLSVTPRTFQYIKQCDDFYEVSEVEIKYWTQWMTHLLKVHTEPTSALAMAAAHKWLQKQSKVKSVLIILTGGNIGQSTMNSIWQNDHLIHPPDRLEGLLV